MWLGAAECLAKMRAESSATRFGFKIQAVAAHILLRLNHRVVQVNRTGHPDIVSLRDGVEYRFEVEAEVWGWRKRLLTAEDFAGLVGGQGVVGYFALAVSFPKPYWVLVPAAVLHRRRSELGNALLEALSDKQLSGAWTRAHFALLEESGSVVRRRSFEYLTQLALAGRPL